MTSNGNPPRIKLPRLTLPELQRRVDAFLQEHHSSGTIPVPIEDIIELSLNVSILPVPGLRSDFGLDAYLSHDARHVVIDDFTYNNHERRTRFSLAHEISHVVLHHDFYVAHTLETPEGVLGFQANVSDEDRKFMEIQAHTFAAHILMPPESFKASIRELELVMGPLDGLTITDVAALAERLADRFDVSEQAVLKHFKLHCPELYKTINQVSF